MPLLSPKSLSSGQKGKQSIFFAHSIVACDSGNTNTDFSRLFKQRLIITQYFVLGGSGGQASGNAIYWTKKSPVIVRSMAIIEHLVYESK